MKKFFIFIFVIIVFMVLFFSYDRIISHETNKFNLADVPTIDKYSSYVFQSSHKKLAGQKVGDKILNDVVTLDIYIPEYTSDKGKVICRFYREYYKTLANKLEGHLEVVINLFDSKENANLSGKKEGNISYKGGIVCNYPKEEYIENVLK